MSEPERVGEVISRGKYPGSGRGKLTLETVKAKWGYIAGENLVSMGEPTGIRRGTLTVTSRNSAWASEFSMASKQIMVRVEEVLGRGVIRNLKVRSSGYLKKAGREEKKQEEILQQEFEVELNGRVKEEIGLLGDEEMREALTRMLKASKAGLEDEN